jgi:hypothetical protein
VACKKGETKNYAQTRLLEVSDLNIDWRSLKSIGFQIIYSTQQPVPQHYSIVTIFTVWLWLI